MLISKPLFAKSKLRQKFALLNGKLLPVAFLKSAMGGQTLVRKGKKLPYIVKELAALLCKGKKKCER